MEKCNKKEIMNQTYKLSNIINNHMRKTIYNLKLGDKLYTYNTMFDDIVEEEIAGIRFDKNAGPHRPSIAVKLHSHTRQSNEIWFLNKESIYDGSNSLGSTYFVHKNDALRALITSLEGDIRVIESKIKESYSRIDKIKEGIKALENQYEN